MKSSLLFFFVGLLFVVMQTTLLHFGPIVPDLILVLCVFWGLYHPTVGGVLGCFALGYSVDVVSSRLLGINAFAMSLVFLAVYLGSRSIWLHNPMVSAFVVFLAALVKGAALVFVWVLFFSVEGFWVGAAKYIIMEAIVAAVLAPALFALLRRGQRFIEQLGVAAQ